MSASNGPSRRTIAAWITGALIAGLGTGVVLGILRPSGTQTVAASAGATSEGATPTPSVTASASASRSPSRSASAPAPQPAVFVAAPWDTKGLELSNLKTVRRTDTGAIEITVDRLTFHTGKKAADYFAKHPELEPAEFAIENQNRRIYTFTLVPGTPIFLGPMIGQTDPPQAADAGQLVDGFARASAAGTEVFVWLRHDNKDKGWVSYLAEQYFP